MKKLKIASSIVMIIAGVFMTIFGLTEQKVFAMIAFIGFILFGVLTLVAAIKPNHEQ
ncbi:MAG: hypothetical protein MJ062_06555 [Oscillospiraceae bacterium]|nr:hypothetical protein [Oscillospiraceae bacterium]